DTQKYGQTRRINGSNFNGRNLFVAKQNFIKWASLKYHHVHEQKVMKAQQDVYWSTTCYTSKGIVDKSPKKLQAGPTLYPPSPQAPPPTLSNTPSPPPSPRSPSLL